MLEALNAQLSISGRTFAPSVNTTFEQDLYILQLMHEAGLRDFAQQFNITDANAAMMSERIIVLAFASGKLFNLLGAVLEEEGVPWSKETALENGKFFAALKTQEEKRLLHKSIVAVILGFFVSGLFSSEISQISSNADLGIEVSPASPPSSEVVATLGNGTGLSEN